MKGFAFVLLCALVAVQGRSTAVQKTTREVATLGENPWVVHLLSAAETGGGLLDSCAGSLIDRHYVLTAARCLQGSRYLWVRFGVVNVINPTLVLENNNNIVNGDLALVRINRGVDYEYEGYKDNIIPIGFDSEFSDDSASLCVFGANEAGGAGEVLSCGTVGLEFQEDGSLVIKSDVIRATQFDIGASVVSNGGQVGVITAAASEDNAGVVTPIAEYLAWIQEHINPEPEVAPEIAPEVVKFVN